MTQQYNNKATDSQTTARLPVDKRSAYHQAGYAAAVYLGNKQKNLPAVHFQIFIKAQGESAGTQPSQIKGVPIKGAKGKRTVKLEGGRLIQSLPVFEADAMAGLTNPEREEYRLAYEADIVNILIGPLAEAKFVALRDNKIFNPNLVYLGALKFYGGRADLDAVNEYLDCIVSQGDKRDHKLAELFLSAYSFVNNRSNWQAIAALADKILEHPKDYLDCNEAIALLESSRLAAA